jgi:hypothetical protein
MITLERMYDYEKEFKWGVWAGDSCQCSSDKKIIDCVLSAPRTNDHNEDHVPAFHDCQIDVEYVTKNCCLKGYKSMSPMPASPYRYLSPEDQKAWAEALDFGDGYYSSGFN